MVDLGSPDTWRWIWLVFAAGALLAELAVAGSFFLAPFAVGAMVAALASFVGVPVPIGWALFVGGSAASFAALRPLAKRLDARSPRAAIGAGRWVNREAMVLRDIPGERDGSSAVGLIRLDREEWRAESLTGDPIPAGSRVLVSRVDGTRLVVVPVDIPLIGE